MKTENTINTISNFKDIDQKLLQDSFQKAFKKPLNTAYFKSLKNFKEAYITSTYTGIAIICSLDENLSYLDKFAVIPDKQRSGLGRLLWQKIIDNHSKLTWRARKENTFNSFYQSQAQEFIETENWMLYIKGDRFKNFPNIHSKLCQLPSSFNNEANNKT